MERGGEREERLSAPTSGVEEPRWSVGAWSYEFSEPELRRTLPPAWAEGMRWVVRRRAAFDWSTGEEPPAAQPLPAYEWFVVRSATKEEAILDVTRESPLRPLRLTFALEPFFLKDAATLDEGGAPRSFYSSARPVAYSYRGVAPSGPAWSRCSAVLPAKPIWRTSAAVALPAADGITFRECEQLVTYWRSGEPWPSVIEPHRRCDLCLVRNLDGTPFEPMNDRELPVWERFGAEVEMTVPRDVFLGTAQWEDAPVYGPAPEANSSPFAPPGEVR